MAIILQSSSVSLGALSAPGSSLDSIASTWQGLAQLSLWARLVQIDLAALNNAGGGGSPGGVVNSVQINKPLGTFGGDANFTYDGTTVKILGTNGIHFIEGNQLASDGTYFYLGDPTGSAFVAIQTNGGSIVQLGDYNGNGHNTIFSIDDGAQLANLNVPLNFNGVGIDITDSLSNTITGGTVGIRLVDTAGNAIFTGGPSGNMILDTINHLQILSESGQNTITSSATGISFNLINGNSIYNFGNFISFDDVDNNQIQSSSAGWAFTDANSNTITMNTSGVEILVSMGVFKFQDPNGNIVESTASGISLIPQTGKNISTTLPAFANDAAAGVGGLTAGMLYQTSGVGVAPLNAPGIVMIKQ